MGHLRNGRIRCFVINCENSQFRRERMLRECAAIDLPIERFSAITPQTLHLVPNTYRPEHTKACWGRALLPTELACALSHISLWRQLLADETSDHYLIFEDDVSFDANLRAILAALDLSGLDFIKLNGMVSRPGRPMREIIPGFTLQRLVYGNLGAAAYVLSKRAAATLVVFCQDCRMAIDILMDRSYEHHIPIYTIVPYPVSVEFCLDNNNPICSNIGVRSKYAADTDVWSKLTTRAFRILTSFRRRLAELRFYLALD